jgi:hypothetical protein
MVMAVLHLICGNCGCAKDFTYEHSDDYVGKDDEARQWQSVIACKNCSTLHYLDENASNKNPRRPLLPPILSLLTDGQLADYHQALFFESSVTFHYRIAGPLRSEKAQGSLTVGRRSALARTRDDWKVELSLQACGQLLTDLCGDHVPLSAITLSMQAITFIDPADASSAINNA